MISVGFDHVGITVASDHLDATVAWYRTILDFSVSHDFEFDGGRYVFMSNGAFKIELCSAGAIKGAPHGSSLSGTHDVEKIHHFCVAVQDLDEVLADLATRGVDPAAGPMQVDQIGQRIAFIKDNVGTVIELTAGI